MISTMKTMFQVVLNEHVPVPPEKRFLIHYCMCIPEDKTTAQ
jgi:hypothetical protein